MAEVGKSTGKKTQAGREVYETTDGEMVSEKSTTFKYKGKWINVPTIHNGYAYDDDILRMMLDAEVIKPTSIHKSKEDAIKSAIERSKSLKFDEGGLASQTEEAFKTKSDRLMAQWDERKLGSGLTSLEFEADMMPLLKKDPIAMLGYKASMPNRRFPSIQKLTGNNTPLYYDVSEDPIGPNYSTRSDKVSYGRDYGSSKDVILHELRHRGLKILEARYKEKDSFIADYGDMAHRLLDKADIIGTKSNEFIVELYDNPDATYIKPGDSGSKNTTGYVADTLQFVDPSSDAQVMPDVADELLGLAFTSEDHDEYRSLVDRDSLSKEEIEVGKSGLNKAAIDLLNEIDVLGFDEGGLANYRRRLVDMTEEERAEVAPGSAAYGNFLGNTGDKKPLSVQMAETGLDLATPIGTIQDIQDELDKKDPSYALIAGMAGLELLGPAAGAIKMAAKSGNKSVIQKILGSFKKKETDNIPGDLPAYDDAGNLDNVLTDEGVVDEIAELQAQKDSGMFNTENDILSAWQAGILNESEYLDETYKVLKNKLKYLEPPKSGKAPEWSDYGQAKKFVDVYEEVGKNKIIQLAKDYPQDADLINKYHAKLGEYADELGIEPENLINVVEDSKAIVGYTPLTEVDLPKAVDTGDIYPRKATEYSRDPLAMPPAMTAADKAGHNLGFKDTVYHLAVNEDEFTNFKNVDEMLPELGEGPTDKFRGVAHDLLGVHVGTARAAAERNKIKSADVFSKDVPRFTMELRARLDKPVRPEELADRVGLDRKDLTLTDDELHFTEGDLGNIIKQKARQMNPGKSYISDTMKHKAAIALRKELAQDGYTHIPYENNVEDMESISYIMLVDRPKDSASVLRDSRAKFDPDQVTSTDLRLAQGGAVDNMSIKKQMSLFEYGGIADDGMNKDPVSGNNVPPGSLAKEVRDDIPAMLSEGEYVVPADVLRYYGVNFFENLRGQAKQGLNTMEQNGRIGGTPMTQQDVARNMQQPMAPAPVQAAQGAMMQSPMRVQQQQAPQAMGNSGIPRQGYAGEDGSIVSRWSPARARYSSPMFQGTSSQEANIQAATESITYMRTHYNQNGESIQIAYEGTDPISAKPKAGQDQLLSDYPLTEEEWAAYQAETGKNTGADGGSGSGDGGSGSGDGGSENGGGTTFSGGSDTSWMDGIDFGDTASVKKWVESDDGLGMSGGARQLADMGVIGLIPQGIQAQDIAKTRGIRNYYESIGDTDMVDYLDGKLKEAEGQGGILFSALDKLGLLSGESYLEQIKSFAPTSLDLQRTFTADQRKEFTDTSSDMVKDEGGASVYRPGGIDVAMVNTSDDGPGLSHAEQHAVNTSRARAAASRAAVESAFEAGASTNTKEEIQDFKEKVEKAGGTWATSGRAEGGLMTTPKPKKKSKPKKTGLAGKK